MLGGQVRGWGALWGFYLWSSGGASTPHPAPPTSCRSHSLFPAHAFPKVCAGISLGRGATTTTPSTHIHARARAHTDTPPHLLSLVLRLRESTQYLGK